MNILDIINNELKDKHFDDLEKLRYIYLRLCQIFSYDYLYYYYDLITNGDSIYERIINYNPNIKDIKSTRIVCFSYTKLLYSLLKELTKELELEINGGIGHKYLIVKYNDKIYKLDATLTDLTRVKMNMSTMGFTTLSNLPAREKNRK